MLAAGLAGASLFTAGPAGAITGGVAAPNGSYPFSAKLDIGGIRSCSGTLVDVQWLLTASSCFPENNGQDGAPAKATTATIGRTNLTQVAPVTKLAFRADRNLVLARLAAPVAGITPVKVATTAPAKDDVVRITGYGRTATEWVPDQLHSATATVDTVAATTLNLLPQAENGATTCKGDSGGPAFRETGGTAELVAVHSSSWQHGCFGETETRQGAVESRVDNLGGWLESQMVGLTAKPAPQHAINLSWVRISSLPTGSTARPRRTRRHCSAP